MKNLLNKIHLGDCLEVMKQIPDESIDCCFSDVPYKIIAGGVRIVGQNDECSGVLNKRKIISDGTNCSNKWLKKNETDIISAVRNGKMFEHNDIEFKEWLPELYRVMKKGTHTYLMINGRNLAELQNEAEKVGFEYQNLLAWIKNNSTPNKYYMQGMEFILMLSKRPAKNIKDMGTKNYFMIPNVKDKVHPTEKPYQLIRQIILQSTNKNDIVLDMFAGSGSTLIACEQLGLRYIGIEIDEIYHKIATQRLKEVMCEVGLFAYNNNQIRLNK